MMIATLCFYVFAAAMLLSALAVISARNPVHSVLFLIFCFFNAAGLFVLLGAEYVAMTLVIVYVGAVAVLFLFVVMMIDVDLSVRRERFQKYLSVGLLLALFLFGELALIFIVLSQQELVVTASAFPIYDTETITNTQALGQIMYTDYVYAFQLSGIILLVSMISAIVLTLRGRKTSLKQNISNQIARKRSDSVSLVNAKSGEGAQ